MTIGGTLATPPSGGWSATSISAPVPAGALSGNVVVTVNGVASNTGSFTLAPAITNVAPASAAAGTTVIITGSSFGAVQGTGAVWLGSTPGAVVIWGNTQIVATVASNSTSGSAQVQQGGALSNSVVFTISTATITNVTPPSVLPGAQVTITGSGFGAPQGSGQVWLGTAYGVVQTWSDTQVVATVAAGSMSGNVQVLQNGVWSNAKPLSIDALNLTSIYPTSGASGLPSRLSAQASEPRKAAFGWVASPARLSLGPTNRWSLRSPSVR